MGHIFVSYNHKDTEYAHKLAKAIQEQGFDVWIDDVIEYGSEWPLEIQEHLDGCDALVVIMTPASYESKWVQNELNRAMRKNKSIFPLLLDGTEPWLSVEATQYTDVRGGKLPPEKFYKLLAGAISRREQKPLLLPPEKPVKRLKLPVNTILLAVLVMVIAIAAFWGGQFLRQRPEPTLTSSTPVPTFTGMPSAIFTETNTSVPTETATSEIAREIVSPQDGMTSLHIPAGTFIMGSNDGFEDEQPMHQVTLGDYWMDKTEVTNYMYSLCVQSGKCPPPSDLKYYSKNKYADYPVLYVNWRNAESYCAWAGRRLPTEAEWEKAARGIEGRIYPWGNDFDCHLGNFDDERQYDTDMVKGGPNCDGFLDIAPTGSFPDGASPYGVLDMAGNAWEWVADWYDQNYYRRSTADNPTGPNSGDERVVRGGSWNFVEVVMRTSNRLKQPPTTSNYYTSFRCATSKSP